MAKTVFDVLKDKLEEKIKASQEFLGSGGAQDYPEYREVCGLIRGLETAFREIEDLSRNFMDDNDE